MKFVNFPLLLCFGVVLTSTSVSAGHRYIAIPIDGLDVIELNPVPSVPRFPRQTEAFVSVPASNPYQQFEHHPQYEASNLQQQQQASTLSRLERASKPIPILDYVDFGAQTGSNGAFSWYADYPAQQH